MSIDNSGVNVDSPTTETGGDQEQIQDQPIVSEDEKTQDDNSNNKVVSESIPYNRFKEKVDEANALRKELSDLKAAQNQTTQPKADESVANELGDNTILNSIVEQAKEKAKEELKAELMAANAENERVYNEQAEQVNKFRERFVNDEEIAGFVSYAKDLISKFGENIDIDKVYTQWDQNGRSVPSVSSVSNTKKADTQSPGASRNPSLVEVAKEALRRSGGN